MSQHLEDVMVDQRIAEVASMPPVERHAAGIRLALHTASRQGRGSPSDVEGVAVNGAELRMFVVRRHGELQVEIERQPVQTRRMG